MDGLANPAGAGAEFTFRGKTYRLAAFQLGDFAELERHVIARRKNPLEAVAKILGTLPKEQQGAVLKAAMEEASSAATHDGEVEDYMTSFDGLCWLFWKLASRGDAKSVESHQAAMDILGGMTAAEQKQLKAAVDIAAGLNELKNSPDQPTEMETDRHESRGLESIVN
jgi:hypothetical protein